jgi:hypothetical protein
MGSLATAYSLSTNAEFRGLIQAALAKASFDVMNEDPGTINHTERLAWAKATIKDPEPVMEKMVWMCLQNATIIASGTSFVEADIINVVNSYVNLLAI